MVTAIASPLGDATNRRRPPRRGKKVSQLATQLHVPMAGIAAHVPPGQQPAARQQKPALVHVTAVRARSSRRPPSRAKRAPGAEVCIPDPTITPSPPSGLALELREDLFAENSFVDEPLFDESPPGGSDAWAGASARPALQPGGWTPTLDLGADYTARAEARLEGSGAASGGAAGARWTPTKDLGSAAVARADKKLVVETGRGVGTQGTSLARTLSHEDRDLSRALHNFRAKNGGEVSNNIRWTSRLPNLASALSRLYETAFLRTRVWKVVDKQAVAHLISLKSTMQSNELHVDGVLVTKIQHTVWTFAFQDTELTLPFALNEELGGTVVIVSKAVPDGTVTCSCFIDDEIVAEEVDNLPPSAAIVSIEIPNFAIRRSVDGSEFVVYEVRVGHADGEAAEAHVLHKRFADFDHLHALLRSVHGTGTRSSSADARLPKLPPKTFGVRRFAVAFLEQRRLLLQEYLNVLIHMRGVSYNPDFLRFLELM
jgi:hypothetical protein